MVVGSVGLGTLSRLAAVLALGLAAQGGAGGKQAADPDVHRGRVIAVEAATPLVRTPDTLAYKGGRIRGDVARQQ